MASSYIFIDSLKRDVYSYPNSGDFVIDGSQTETWNMIRSSTPHMPVNRSQDQYYNIRMCTLTLPFTEELLCEPGVFVCFNEDNKSKTKMINHIETIKYSGFPCGEVDDFKASSLSDLAGCVSTDMTGACEDKIDALLLDKEKLKNLRAKDAREYYKYNNLHRSSFFMICDKVQNDAEGNPKWIHYKTCMDQVSKMNFRGNAIRFTVCNTRGKAFLFTTLTEEQCSGTDLWRNENDEETCEEMSPVNIHRQVYASFEVTYISHRGKFAKDVHIVNDI